MSARDVMVAIGWDGMVDLVRERSMLARVREAWGFPIQVNPPRTGPVWLVYAITGAGSDFHHADCDGRDQTCALIGRGPTEQDALQSALDAKP